MSGYGNKEKVKAILAEEVADPNWVSLDDNSTSLMVAAGSKKGKLRRRRRRRKRRRHLNYVGNAVPMKIYPLRSFSFLSL